MEDLDNFKKEIGAWMVKVSNRLNTLEKDTTVMKALLMELSMVNDRGVDLQRMIMTKLRATETATYVNTVTIKKMLEAQLKNV